MILETQSQGQDNKRKASDISSSLPPILLEFVERTDARMKRIEEQNTRIEGQLETLFKTISNTKASEQSPRTIVGCFDSEQGKEEEDEWSDASIVDKNDQWSLMFSQAREYRIIHGHCKIPGHWGENQKLATWSSNQKMAYNKYKNGRKEYSPERILKLESIDFWWGKKYPQRPSWDEMFGQLEDFKNKMGYIDVPFNQTNPNSLAKWCFFQRCEYKRFKTSLNSLLTLDQIGKLKTIGFKWKGPKLW